jgi:hypothetical protein
MATPILNYFKMANLWAKDRAIGDYAETAKEKRARYATLTTIDGIDLMVSKNEVSLENFKVEECDQMRSPEINVVRSQVPSQEAFSSKSKKKKKKCQKMVNVIMQFLVPLIIYPMQWIRQLRLWKNAL